MGRGAWYIIAVVAVIIVVGASAEVSVRSAACMACHQQEASFAHWMGSKLKAEKKGFSHELVACADCHMEGAPQGTATSKLRALLHTVTYLVPQIDPRRPEVSGLFNRTRIPSENCQYCHLGAIQRKSVFLKDLPPELKKIGLAMDHRKHVLARDDTCVKCHERYKDGAGQVDKTVTYTEVNHLACDSCHTQASHSYRNNLILPISQQQYDTAREDAWKRLSTNPRWMVSIPTEQSCRRCHNGKIHYKTKIFLADCRNGRAFEDCQKCHPLMTKEYFDQYRRERQQTAASEMNDNRSPEGVASAVEASEGPVLSPHQLAANARQSADDGLRRAR
jgi:nitrate/TMAO reductase-like tetraheme cytochrome c subunit